MTLALFTSACAGTGRDDRQAVEWRDDPSLPCPRLPSQSSTTPPSDVLDVERLRHLPVDVAVGPVKLWAGHLSYPVDRKRVVVCDLAQGRSTVVAEIVSEDDAAAVYDYVVGSGEHVLWTRLSKLPNVIETVDWAMEAMRLSTGERQVIAEQRGGIPDLVPRPAIEGRWVAWAQEEAGGVSVRLFDLATGDRRTLAPASVRAGNVGITPDGTVVFDGSSGPEDERDVFAVPADGRGDVRRLTHQGAVQPLALANGRVTWRNRLSEAGEGERWTMVPGPDENPVEVHATGRAVPGPDFLVTEEGDGLAVHPVAPGAAALALVDEGQRLDRGALWDVRGDVVAWVTVDYPPVGPLRRHLHIAQLRR